MTTYMHRRETLRLAVVSGAPPSQCQYIAAEQDEIKAHIREHRTSEGLFCNAPSVPGKPYCHEHADKCFAGFSPISPVPVLDKAARK